MELNAQCNSMTKRNPVGGRQLGTDKKSHDGQFLIRREPPSQKPVPLENWNGPCARDRLGKRPLLLGDRDTQLLQLLQHWVLQTIPYVRHMYVCFGLLLGPCQDASMPLRDSTCHW